MIDEEFTLHTPTTLAQLVKGEREGGTGSQHQDLMTLLQALLTTSQTYVTVIRIATQVTHMKANQPRLAKCIVVYTHAYPNYAQNGHPSVSTPYGEVRTIA